MTVKVVSYKIVEEEQRETRKLFQEEETCQGIPFFKLEKPEKKRSFFPLYLEIITN